MKYPIFISHILKSNGQNHPARDWFILLVVVWVLLIGSAGWNLWLFKELANGKMLGSVARVQTEKKGVQVTDVQEIFKSRAAERVHYQNDYTFVDPSVPGS